MPALVETEQELLFRIARRNGFSEHDLTGKSSEFISHLIAARDKGHFCNAVKDRTLDELKTLLRLNREQAKNWLTEHPI